MLNVRVPEGGGEDKTYQVGRVQGGTVGYGGSNPFGPPSREESGWVRGMGDGRRRTIGRCTAETGEEFDDKRTLRTPATSMDAWSAGV